MDLDVRLMDCPFILMDLLSRLMDFRPGQMDFHNIPVAIHSRLMDLVLIHQDLL